MQCPKTIIPYELDWNQWRSVIHKYFVSRRLGNDTSEIYLCLPLDMFLSGNLLSLEMYVPNISLKA